MDGSDEHDVEGGGASVPYAFAGAVGRPRADGRPTVRLARAANRPAVRLARAANRPTVPLPTRAPKRRPEPVTENEAGSPAPHRRRPPLTTMAAVCVIAASLALVGWINWQTGESSAPGGRYSVVDQPPNADGFLPPAVQATRQPLVPLLPPERAGGGTRSGSPSHKPTTAASGRAATPPPTRVVTGPAGAISGYVGNCLRVPDGRPADGAPVSMTPCDGGPSERWIMASDGTVRASGKCLDVVGDQVVDGAAVQLSTCDGSPGQQWRFTAGRDLVNPNADKCLDVRDLNPTDGALAQLWTCTGGPNQKWSVPA